MSETTSSRLLTLLSLLQGRRDWPGDELAQRLEVSGRTIRRDVERLRELGYSIESTRGVAGGYRLEAGTGLPPLLLSDDEGVAIAVGLRSQAAAGLRGAEHTTMSALAKIEQVLPPALRRRIEALQAVATPTGAPGSGSGPGAAPSVDSDLLGLLALCCRDGERVRMRYTDAAGAPSARSIEPHRLVPLGRRWYLLAWDRDRDDWRTFRLDRMREAVATTWRFRPREHPDPVAYVQRAVTEAAYPHLARVRLHAPAERVRELVPPQVARVEDDDCDGWCVLVVGGVDLDWVAVHVVRLGFEAEVVEPAELRAAAVRLARGLATLGGVDSR